MGNETRDTLLNSLTDHVHLHRRGRSVDGKGHSELKIQCIEISE